MIKGLPTLDDSKFFRGGWGVSRNSDNMDMVYWLYNRTGDPKLLELGEKLMRTVARQRWRNAYVQHRNQDPKVPWPAWEIIPTSPWNYGLVLDSAKPELTIKMVKKDWPADDQPFRADSSPIELQASARIIPNWVENYWGTVDRLQPSPMKVDTKTETVTMIPMGAARLRMSALPVIGNPSQGFNFPSWLIAMPCRLALAQALAYGTLRGPCRVRCGTSG